MKAGGQLSYLAGGVSASDFAPTTQQRAVQRTLEQQVRATRSALQALLDQDLASFNRLLASRGLKVIDAKLPAVVF